MQRSRHRRRVSRVLLLVALLLVPLAARAHTHQSGSTSTTCATCIAAHHAPSVGSASPAAVPIVAAAPARLEAPTPASEPQRRSPRTGRAPPGSSLVAHT
ncbi:MAG: hypothetical protein E6J71_08180 [Deltaproteobacteria bacterium]|nr:MAG: hypothetical protein E6J71_08180 [Deltaproteobacteria bacterium]